MIGLMIGRFQPLHRGHVKSIKKMILECEECIIGIGSSQYGYTRRNPFTYDERVKMFPVEIKDNAKIVPIPDIHNWSGWVDHVIERVGVKPDVIYSGSEITTKLFRDADYPVRELKRDNGISGTDIRKSIEDGDHRWVGKLPQTVMETVLRIGGKDRIQHLCSRGDKIGVDIHGVIDSSPNTIKEILRMLRLMGIEIIIISGPPLPMIKDQLTEMGLEIEKHYDKVYSIVNHLKDTGCKRWKKNGLWYASEEDWNRSKGEICEKEKISFMIDDSEMYRNDMPDFTKFLLVEK